MNILQFFGFNPSATADILTKLEKIMVDTANIKAAADRIIADSAKEMAMLQDIKAQNVDLAAKLAAIQTGDPASQAALDDIAKQLNDTSDMIEAALAPVPAPVADV